MKIIDTEVRIIFPEARKKNLDLSKETMTLFIPGPFGLRKSKRANYNTDFK